MLRRRPSSGGPALNCAMMQPTFLPWQGFFELMLESERFIFLDDFQFSLQSYHQRNRLFVGPGRAEWYTVPIEKAASYQAPLNQARIADHGQWADKTLKRIQANYGRAPYYDRLYPWLAEWLGVQHESLAEMNISFIEWVCESVGIRTEMRRSSGLASAKVRSEHVLELLRWCEADRYLCAHGAFDYMLADGVFPAEGIEVLFQNYVCGPYPQVGSPGGFVPNLSVLDGLMNVGPEGVCQLVSAGTRKWLTWDEMKCSRASGADT